jgi:enterochelin esterase-like enzyme
MDARTLLARAYTEGTPLIDGDTVTFVWQGDRAPQLVGDWTNWEGGAPIALQPVAPRVWTHTQHFPRAAYLEYAFVHGQRRVPDRFNPRTTPNGLGATNHFFYMPGAAPTPLTKRARAVPRGTVTRHQLPTEGLVPGKAREVYVYQPPVDEPVPLLVVLDGVDCIRRAKLPVIVDNLIAQRHLRPLALALVQNGGAARMVEYACSEATLAFLLSTVLPFARSKLNLMDVEASPGAFGILGASMGGLMALYAGVREPQVFGHVLSQSGAFTIGRDLVVYDLIREGNVKPLQLWMDVGRFEWLLETSRRMYALLQEKGYDVTFREYDAGHNYPAWRDDVWRGLEKMLGVSPWHDT